MARSTWGRRDADGVRSDVERMPEHADFVLEEGGGMRPVIVGADVATALASAQRAAITADVQADLRMAASEQQKTALRAKARCRMSMWSVGCRRLVLQVVLDERGTVVGSPAKASKEMHKHGAPVLANDAPTDEASVWALLSFVQTHCHTSGPRRLRRHGRATAERSTGVRRVVLRTLGSASRQC